MAVVLIRPVAMTLDVDLTHETVVSNVDGYVADVTVIKRVLLWKLVG